MLLADEAVELGFVDGAVEEGWGVAKGVTVADREAPDDSLGCSKASSFRF